jgi:hypothetical protein
MLIVITIAFVALYNFEPVFKNLRLVLTLRIFLIIILCWFSYHRLFLKELLI